MIEPIAPTTPQISALARGVLIVAVMKRHDSDGSGPRERNEGEGNRTAARHYNDRLRKFVADGKVDDAAESARAFVDRDPEQAARAERAAKRGPRGVRRSVDELVAAGRTLADRIEPLVRRTIGRVRSRFARK